MSQEGKTNGAVEAIAVLQQIVGRQHVLCSAAETRRYCTGYRFGGGRVLAVVRPGSLVEQWQVLQACIAADVAVIMQAANTGLTGGSTPHGAGYDRPVVVVNTLRITGVQLIGAGTEALCLAGTTLFELERALKPAGREPHSVIGSSCIGASVLGGVCNNSGGSLVKRGPAFTEMALFAQVGPDGVLRLVNHLGIDLGSEPEAMLQRLESASYTESDVHYDTGKRTSDREYVRHVRDIGADTPARFNADPRRLHEASGSAGKVAVFAVRLATFPSEGATTVFYVGTNDAAELTQLRRVMLSQFADLPVAAEYIHRTAFDIAAKYGKDTFLAIQWLGTDRLPWLFRLKASIDSLTARLGLSHWAVSDRLLQAIASCFPAHLPERMRDFHGRYEHHLLLRMSGSGVAQAREHLGRVFPSRAGAFFECTDEEGSKAFLHRFAVAGAAVRYRAVHARQVEDIVALDIALPRNAVEWQETLPAEIDEAIMHRLYYGHFFCYVFHQDYIVAKGRDPAAIEHRMCQILDRRGAEYPAEHNVGHLYQAKPALESFYRDLDPENHFNPGIGRTSKCRHWL